jgi:hypothetical protein
MEPVVPEEEVISIRVLGLVHIPAQGPKDTKEITPFRYVRKSHGFAASRKRSREKVTGISSYIVSSSEIMDGFIWTREGGRGEQY